MRSTLAFFFSTLLLVPSLALAATTPSEQPTIVTPAQLHWIPGTGAMAGADVAVISGDPTKAGPYVIRLRLPDGGKFAPHFHGDTENVTVLEGTLMVGLGDTVDPSKMMALPAGSFVSVPKGVHHYAMAKGTTIVQIHGVGPATMTNVSP